MTTASASATSIEHGDPYIRRKNWIASLSNKNNEILEDLSKFSQQRSQALTAINSQLETISPHLTNGSNENHIDNLMNSLKFKQRRENFHQPSSSVTRLDLSGNAKDLSSNTLGMEDGDGFINETKTILEDNERHSSKSNIISNKDSKSDLSVSGGELDWKYLAAENHNSDSEEQTENLNGIGEKNEEDKEVLDRRRNKVHPNLTINTNPTVVQNSKSNRRPITPESSDSEFDISTAHIEFAPSLFGKDSSRVRQRSVSDVGFSANRSRPVSMTFNSVDEVIEEEVLGSLSDSGEALDTTFGDNVKRPSTKSSSLESARKRVPTLRKYSDDFGIDNTRVNKFHRKIHDETPFSTADIADDNSSVRSDNSFLEELGAIKNRLKRLELEQDDVSRTRRVRRPTGNSDTIIPPSAISPGSSSQGGASNSTTSSRQLQAVQHQKHLQNAFEFFEKAFAATDQLTTDASPPPTHSMAMVVYSAQQLNHKLRVFMSQTDNDSEKTVRDLLKASDEQIRSLTECLLALPTLLPKKPPIARKTSAEREYQYVTRNIQPQNDAPHLGISHPVRSTRSVSPRLPVSREEGLQDSNMTVDSSQRISPIPPATDQSSPPMSYYSTTRSLRQSNNRASTYSEYGNETQASILRTHSFQERHGRHFSGSAHASMSGILSSSPPHSQNNQYEQPSANHRPRLSHRYSNSSSSSGYVPSPTTIQRPLSRVSNGYVRSEENSPHPLHYPVPLRTSSRAYNTPRAYDQIRRYQNDPTPQPMERERRYTASSVDLDGRFERRAGGSVNDSLQEVGYSGTPIYGDNSLDRKFAVRDRNTGASEYSATGDSEGLRRSVVSNGAAYRKSLIIYPSAEVEGTGEASGGGNVEGDNVHGDGNGEGGGGEGGPNDTNVEKNEKNGYI